MSTQTPAYLSPALTNLAFLAACDATADYRHEKRVAIKWRHARLIAADQPAYDLAYDAVLLALSRGTDCLHCLCEDAENAIREYQAEGVAEG